MLSLLKPVVGEVPVTTLNIQGQADYLWVDGEGHIRQWERKQIGEILSDMDAVEEQLNREMRTSEELTLSIEGVWMPTADGIQIYNVTAGNKFWRPGFKYDRRPGLTSKLMSWIWSLQHVVGIEVITTPHLDATAHAIAAAFRQSYKKPEEHTTMRRYLREHIAPFSPNPHVENFIRLVGAGKRGTGIGPERAQKLIERFGTFWNAINQPKAVLEIWIGKSATENLFTAIGRKE